MAQSLKWYAYRFMYILGKTPPSSEEIAASLAESERKLSTAGAGPRCDCQVLSGDTQVACYPNILDAACQLIGDSQPGLTGVPLPLGSCHNLPAAGGQP